MGLRKFDEEIQSSLSVVRRNSGILARNRRIEFTVKGR